MNESEKLLEFYLSIEPYVLDILNSEDIYRNVWEIIQEFPDEVATKEFEDRIRNEVKYWTRKNEIVMDEEGKLIEVLLEYEIVSQIVDDNRDYLDELDEEQIEDYNKNLIKLYLILNKRLYNLCGSEFSSINDYVCAEGFDDIINKIGKNEVNSENTTDNLLGWE